MPLLMQYIPGMINEACDSHGRCVQVLKERELVHEI